MMQSKDKLRCLDGLRGLMALHVVIHHAMTIYYPEKMYTAIALSRGEAPSLLSTTGLSALVNGNIAVQYFFVLTGFLVGRTVFLQPDMDAASLRVRCANRYLRLLPMIAVATLFTHLLFAFGVQPFVQIAPYVHGASSFAGLENSLVSLPELLRIIFYDTFFRGNVYMMQLWTIRNEFMVYILALIACWLLRDSRWRRLLYVALAVGISKRFMYVDLECVGFFLGVLVADVHYRPQSQTLLSPLYQRVLERSWFAWLCGAVGVYFAVCPLEFGSHYAIWYPIFRSTDVCRAFGMAAVVYALLHIPVLQKPLEFAPLQWLGKLSYAVYALHWTILLTVDAALFAWMRTFWPYWQAAVAAFAITLPVIYAVAWLAWRLVEKDRHYDIRNLHWPLKPKTAKAEN